MKTKFLYANGDSFGFGQELDGPRDTANFYTFSEFQRQHCYSGVIANKLGLQYKNESLPGGSNQRIYRTTLESVSKLLKIYQPDEIFVLISLSHSLRREFYNTAWKTYYPYMPTCRPPAGPHLELWHTLTGYFQDERSDYEYDQMMVLGIQNFLRVNRVPYLLSWSMHHPIIYDDEVRLVPPEILQQRYDHRFYQRPSFAYHVFHELGLQRAPEGHPLVDGHAAWANRLLEYVDANNLFDNGDLCA